MDGHRYQVSWTVQMLRKIDAMSILEGAATISIYFLPEQSELDDSCANVPYPTLSQWHFPHSQLHKPCDLITNPDAKSLVYYHHRC